MTFLIFNFYLFVLGFIMQTIHSYVYNLMPILFS